MSDGVITLLLTLVLTVGCWVPLWPMLFGPEPIRVVPPVRVYSDVPNATFDHGGLV